MTTISDESCKLHFLILTKKCIEKQRKNNFDESDLTQDDLTVIEYELKDCAARSVSCNLSQQGCSHIFSQRVKRLSEGDREEWTLFKQRVSSSARHLTPEQIIDLDHLAKTCQKKQ